MATAGTVMPARGGKPKLPPEARRSEWVTFRVTIVEADAICQGAIRAGKKIGDYLMGRAGFRVTDTSEAFQDECEPATLRVKR